MIIGIKIIVIITFKYIFQEDKNHITNMPIIGKNKSIRILKSEDLQKLLFKVWEIPEGEDGGGLGKSEDKGVSTYQVFQNLKS
jgi:hypothetical protein